MVTLTQIRHTWIFSSHSCYLYSQGITTYHSHIYLNILYQIQTFGPSLEQLKFGVPKFTERFVIRRFPASKDWYNQSDTVSTDSRQNETVSSKYDQKQKTWRFLELREKCSNKEFFLIRIQGNTDQKNSVLGYFSRIGWSNISS